MTRGQKVSDGTAVYTDRVNGADTAVQSLADGSARAYVIINRPDAPTSYRFDFALPLGAHFTKLQMSSGEGIALVGSSGAMLGTIQPAWARAADGSSVATNYQIEGTTIVQTVLHHGAQYPVVADPWYSFGCCSYRGYYLVIHLSYYEEYQVLFGSWAVVWGATQYACSRFHWILGAACGVGGGVIADAVWQGALNTIESNGWGCGVAVEVDTQGYVGSYPECPW